MLNIINIMNGFELHGVTNTSRIGNRMQITFEFPIKDYSLTSTGDIYRIEPMRAPLISEYELVTEDELYTKPLKYSKIKSCVIKREDGTIVVNEKRGFRTVWDALCASRAGDSEWPALIREHTGFNYQDGDRHGSGGWSHVPSINMSFQNKNSDASIKEIIKIIKICNYSMVITIKIKDGATIKVVI